MSDEPPSEPGGLAAWAGVAFFCTLLAWLPLAAFVNTVTNAALDAALPGRFAPATTTRLAFAALLLAHLAAYAASVAAGAFVVGRFGGGAPIRSVYLGAGVLVGVVVAFTGAGAIAVGLGAALVLAPLGIAAARFGFRVGRHKRAKGI